MAKAFRYQGIRHLSGIRHNSKASLMDNYAKSLSCFKTGSHLTKLNATSQEFSLVLNDLILATLTPLQLLTLFSNLFNRCFFIFCAPWAPSASCCMVLLRLPSPFLQELPISGMNSTSSTWRGICLLYFLPHMEAC